MKFLVIATVVTFFSPALSAPASNYVVHQKRQIGDSNWAPSDIKLDGRMLLPISIGLSQRNLDKTHDFLMGVSDPDSPDYAKHWTVDQVTDAFAPSRETINGVKQWLANHGISESRIEISKSSSWIMFNSTIEEAETLMQTKYQVYEHPKTKKPHVACEEYSVPIEIKEYIDFITPTIGFDAYLTNPEKVRTHMKRSDGSYPQRAPSPKRDGAGGQPQNGAKPGPSVVQINDTTPKPGVVGGAKFGTLPIPHGSSPDVSASALSYCSSWISPDCLRALYGFPIGSVAKSSFGVYEDGAQSYLQSDLNGFYAGLAINVPLGTPPIFGSIDGGVANVYDPNNNLEANLDLQYAIALVWPQKVTVYQTGDRIEGGSFNNFLDAIDGSYCTYGGGDLKGYDSIYPDPSAGGYKGAKNCGGFAPTAVISVSYGGPEAIYPAAYMERQCTEYAKLGLMGVTMVYSSGDNGVASHGDQCCYYNDCYGGYMNQPGTGGGFSPQFPVTCPYITAVGATQIVPGASVTSPEIACETVIHSGGGFSNYFAIPSYQTSAVGTYFKKHPPPYSYLYYNNSGKSRGYPDIAANGANYMCAIDGYWQELYGTSASAPTVGSIITLINEQRALAGKKSVGFINPVLYANPSAMNDITSGNNPGCLTNGFSAVAGWDPVTGLGTPNYPKLLKAFMALP
ncbi:subtilisin-like protein [Mollisia scopiformis]|uniref:tripeptidyl-peptidase II n=1 Tax=Mollisia scopiformis TaxID=149040 RepID=A0A194X0K9_MOLSC|nr:subtilisin-like protein [Mollisia scopiformis]KUJ13731.1 subtilisin-like protein [Mollisia scopiformis]